MFAKISPSRYTLFLVITTMFLSCKKNPTDETPVATVQLFTKNMIVADFNTAMQYATPESRKWLLFHSSNLTQKELDILNTTQKIEIKDTELLNDSTALVSCIIPNIIYKNIFNEDDAQYTNIHILTIKRDGKWWVKMEGPLQSGM